LARTQSAASEADQPARVAVEDKGGGFGVAAFQAL